MSTRSWLHRSRVAIFIAAVQLTAAVSDPATTVFNNVGNDFRNTLSWNVKAAAELLPCFDGVRFTQHGVEARNVLKQFDARSTLFRDDWQGMERLLDAYLSFSEKILSQASQWPLDGVAGVQRAELLRSHGLPLPFVQRVVLPQQSNLVIFGDLHGSVHSFLRELQALQQKELLADDFTLHADTHLVFCGDYVDRGFYGVEVISILLRLKLRNPNNVHIVRGNHEDRDMNEENHGGTFLRELQSKFPESDTERIFDFYETLPLALFLCVHMDGRETSPHLLFVHGGIEVGFDAQPLLVHEFSLDNARSSASGYAIIHALRRKDWLVAQPSSIVDGIPRRLHHLFVNYGKHPQPGKSTKQHDDAHVYPAGPTGTEPANGFLWWDFFVHDTNTVLDYSSGRGFLLGKPVTRRWLAENRVVAVFRAHQHNDNPQAGPMLSEMRRHGGTYDNWQGSGMVLTSLSGGWIPYMNFPFDTFILLELHSSHPTSWAVNHCNQRAQTCHVRTDGTWLPTPPAFQPEVDLACNMTSALTCSRLPWHSEVLNEIMGHSDQQSVHTVEIEVPVNG